MTDHVPAHAPRSLAARTIAAVLSTLGLAISITVVAVGLPFGLTQALQGPVVPLSVAEVAPVEPHRLVACMGPAIAFSGQNPAPVGYGAPTDQIAGSAATVTPLTETDLQDAFSLEALPVPAPAVIVTQPAESGPLAGVSYQQLDNLNVRGLAMAECQVPRTETWLVGADTTTGRQAVLSLINPGQVLATVDIEVWGADGPISTPLGKGILVAPDTQRVFSLAGFAPEEPRPVMRVTAQGTGVVASLHYSIVRGLEADGLAVITGQPEPSVKRVITGLYTPPEEIIGPVRGKEGYADVGGLLRVLAPDAAAIVSVRIIRPSLGDIETELRLEAGQVGDLALDEIGSGEYSIIIESDQPVVAGVRNSVGTDARTDTSWVGSSYPISQQTLFAVPSVGETRISVVNAGENAVTVTIDGVSVPLEAGSMIARPIVAGTSFLAAEGEVFAVVSSRAENSLGHLQVLPAPMPQEPVSLRVR